jgi:dephospho-CoA kinase
MSPVSIPIIGIVGGIGSGKSALADWLPQHLRVVVLDADAAGHAALRQAAVRSELRTAFGAEVFAPTGEVDRRQLAHRVFGDSPAHHSARRHLEAIVHPVIRGALETQIAEARRSGECDLIVLDAAVMLESGWSELCDAIVFVDVPRAARVSRVLTTRGWSEAELDRREASQWPLDRKLAAADIVIDNSGSVESAGRSLLAALQSRFPHLNRSQRSTDAAPSALTGAAAS